MKKDNNTSPAGSFLLLLGFIDITVVLRGPAKAPRLNLSHSSPKPLPVSLIFLLHKLNDSELKRSYMLLAQNRTVISSSCHKKVCKQAVQKLHGVVEASNACKTFQTIFSVWIAGMKGLIWDWFIRKLWASKTCTLRSLISAIAATWDLEHVLCFISKGKILFLKTKMFSAQPLSL